MKLKAGYDSFVWVLVVSSLLWGCAAPTATEVLGVSGRTVGGPAKETLQNGTASHRKWARTNQPGVIDTVCVTLVNRGPGIAEMTLGGEERVVGVGNTATTLSSSPQGCPL